MVSIVLAIFLGVAFTLIAISNRTLVTVNVLGLFATLPLYVIGAISFLAGIGVTLFFHLFDSIATNLDLSSKDDEIRKATRANQDLAHEYQKLEVENAHLKERINYANSQLHTKRVEIAKDRVRAFFDRLRGRDVTHAHRITA